MSLSRYAAWVQPYLTTLFDNQYCSSVNCGNSGAWSKASMLLHVYTLLILMDELNGDHLAQPSDSLYRPITRISSTKMPYTVRQKKDPQSSLAGDSVRASGQVQTG